MRHFWKPALVVLILLQAWPLFAENKLQLLDPSAKGIEQRFAPNGQVGDQVKIALSTDASAPGINVTIQPGDGGYPGVSFKPDGASWDLSQFGHVKATVVNTGDKPLGIALRVDNTSPSQSEPWNAEQAYILPGAKATVNVIFGYSFGHKPGYALDPKAVTEMLIFAQKSDAPQSFRIESIEAGGAAGEKPPVDPNSIRIVPKDGVMLGSGVAVDLGKQVSGTVAKSALSGDALQLTFGPANSSQFVKYQPAQGRWDLRSDLEVRIKVKNTGNAPIAPSAQLLGNGGPTETAAAQPIAPGAEGEIVIPFTPSVSWQGSPLKADLTHGIVEGKQGTGSSFTSDAVAAVVISLTPSEADATLIVESITSDLPPAAALPDWLGKKPPVDGDWTKTFDDEFDGSTLDQSKWNVTGPNYYDKTSHWTKDDVIVGDGFAKLRYQKKTGHPNDDPKQPETPYASGYLDTFGKWVQRYGYFEARVKLPTAPGLWPAFWMMPDRGPAAGPQWKRQDTANGGMEFDIMEHLDRWGPYRYNIAMHWDGYADTHKQTGSGGIYVQPDKDGFLTVGLLWTPGSAVYYCNGREVGRWEDPRVSSVPSELMFTLPMGGWDNDGLDDAKLPADFAIDYVRCWQRKDLASKADTAQPATNP